MSTEIEKLCQKIGYKFNKLELLTEALSHPSLGVNKKMPSINYERLEFFGDSILGFIIAEYLFITDKTATEGTMSKKFSSLVSRDYCYKVGLKLNVSQALLISSGEESNGGRDLKANIANAIEAIIAAIFLDGGMENAKKFVLKYWESELKTADSHQDYKSLLQEWSQNRYGGILPTYNVVDIKGADHAPSFTVTVKIANLPEAKGTGSSKKEAEKMAAQAMLNNINLLNL